MRQQRSRRGGVKRRLVFSFRIADKPVHVPFEGRAGCVQIFRACRVGGTVLAIAPFRQRNLRHKIVGKAEIEDVFSGSVWIPGVVGRSKSVGKHAGGTGVRGQSVGQQIGDRRAAAVAGDQIYRVADVVFFSFILIFLGNFVYKSRCISFTVMTTRKTGGMKEP